MTAPGRAELSSAEYRSGSFLSEAQSAILPLFVPPPPRRRFPLRARLALWLLLCALLPLLLLGVLSHRHDTLAAQEQVRALALSLGLLWSPPPGAYCAALSQTEESRLGPIARRTGHLLAVYAGERRLWTSAPALLPRLPGEICTRVLESGQPVVLPLVHQGRAYLAAAVHAGPTDPAAPCQRLILLVAVPRDQAPRHLMPALLLLLLLLVSLVLFLPARLSSELGRLHDRVQLLLRRGGDAAAEEPPRPAGGTDDDRLLRRGDEIGDLARAVALLGETVRESEHRLSARLRELTTLHTIGRAISMVLDLQEALNKILGEVVAVFSARRGAIILVGPDMRYQVGAAVRIDSAAQGAIAALGEVLVRRGAVRIDDLSRDPELSAAARHSGLSGSLMAVPLDQQGRILGVLLITRSRGRQRFTDSDLRLLSTVADQASTAISNARLYNEVQRASEDLELRVKERTLDLVMANEELNRVVENLHRAQAQLVLSERLAGLGQLVAGVAHEVNSPAGAIQGAADALRENVVRVSERVRQLAELPLTEAARADFLAMCDEIAPTLEGGALLPPAQLRQKGREWAERLGALLATSAPESASGHTELLSACRTLAELGIDDPAVVDRIAAAARTLPQPARGLAILAGYLEQRAYLHRNVAAIRTAIGQIMRIVGALKSYSHLDQARVELTDVHDGLETTLVILHSELKYGIILTRKYGTVPAIHAYVDELNQVWTNLLHNAVQALHGRAEDGRPKEIIIESGYRPAEGAGAPAEPGEIWVAIEDNGPGIPKEILPRIFEPFFTTKHKGEGTGLGLGIVRQIVDKHRGRIEVSSEPGRTRFTVHLPVRAPVQG
jgi:signal transduction histidine kinase